MTDSSTVGSNPSKVPPAVGERRPSMVDVARAAGVALVTVSRALQGDPAVRPVTRERVERAAAELNYRRNDIAQTLRKGRSTTIGVVISGPQLYELPRILFGMETVADEAGYWVTMTSAQGGGGGRLIEAVKRLTSQLVEGIVVISNREVALEELQRFALDVPVTVVMSGDVGNPAIGSVEVDQEAGARLATHHLLGLGHRHIAHISGPEDSFDGQARVAGWRRAMATESSTRAALLQGDFSAASGYQRMMELRESGDRSTAVLMGNDYMAIGALAALHSLGLTAPNDVSIIGFDDIAGSDFLLPPLTTVRQDYDALGHRAMDVLLGIMSGEAPRHHLIDPILVVRSSTAPPLSVTS